MFRSLVISHDLKRVSPCQNNLRSVNSMRLILDTKRYPPDPWSPKFRINFFSVLKFPSRSLPERLITFLDSSRMPHLPNAGASMIRFKGSKVQIKNTFYIPSLPGYHVVATCHQTSENPVPRSDTLSNRRSVSGKVRVRYFRDFLSDVPPVEDLMSSLRLLLANGKR